MFLGTAVHASGKMNKHFRGTGEESIFPGLKPLVKNIANEVVLDGIISRIIINKIFKPPVFCHKEIIFSQIHPQ